MPVPPSPHFPSPYRRPQTPPAEARRVAMPDGALVAAFAYGDLGGPENDAPVLMLHGNGEEHGIFGPTIDAVVAVGRGVLALDSRAQGASTRGTERLGYELLAADALRVADAFDVRSFHVLGFSDGAIEALLLARDAPERVRSVLAIGANLTPEGVMAENGWDVAAEAAANEAWAAWAETAPAEVDASMLTPAPAEARAAAELLRLMLEEPHINPASLAAVRCPVTVMAGEFDCIASWETVRIAQAVTDARLVVVPDQGHTLPKHAPDAVTSELLALL